MRTRWGAIRPSAMRWPMQPRRAISRSRRHAWRHCWPSGRVGWVQGLGAWGRINSDGNAAEVNRNLGGVFTGFDQRFGDWVVGIAGGYTNSSVNVSARASSANIDAAHLAAYAGTSFGAWN